MSGVEISPEGPPAPVARIFGWAMLAILLAFMINNVLIVGWDYPGARAGLSGDSKGLVQVVIYLIAIATAIFFVLRTPYRALRWDARNISDFNAYLIRAFFFAVLFVGIVDASIAFMRVERLLPIFFDTELVKGFGRPQ